MFGAASQIAPQRGSTRINGLELHHFVSFYT
jgi:hypothetical protein